MTPPDAIENMSAAEELYSTRALDGSNGHVESPAPQEKRKAA